MKTDLAKNAKIAYLGADNVEAEKLEVMKKHEI